MAGKRGRPMGKLHQDDVRRKIQASMLINMLHDCASGVKELTPTQMKSIEILLKKSLPDLSSVEISGDDENPLQTVSKVVFEVVNPQG